MSLLLLLEASTLQGAAALLVVVLILVIIYPNHLIGTAKRPQAKSLSNALPLIGDTLMVLQVSLKRKRILDEFLKAQQNEGKGLQPITITFPSLGRRLIMINAPEYIHFCQKTEFENFVKGSNFHDRLADVLGAHGIFVADGEIWKRQRKMASHIFSVGNFRTCVQQTIHRDLDQLCTLMSDATQGGQMVNLPDIFFRFTLSTFSQIAFSADVDCLPDNVAGLSKRNAFADAFDYAQLVADNRFVAVLPLWLETFTVQGYKMRKALRVLKTYCYHIIDLRLAARARGESQGAVEGKHGKDLLELFMDMGLSRDDLLPIVLNFLIAGRDTTAQSLAWTFYRLWQNPEVVKRIRAELTQTFGSLSAARQRHLTYDDMKALPYLHATFYEAIRLNPAVPKNIKQVTRDTVIRPHTTDEISRAKSELNAVRMAVDLPNIPVRKGESVVWSDYVMARSPEIWGADCAEFKPERFLEQSSEKGDTMSVKNYPQAIFHAFNAGPRVCLGQTLATYEGMAAIAALVSRFDFTYDHQTLQRDPPTYADSLTHPIRNPYSVGVQLHSKEE